MPWENLRKNNQFFLIHTILSETKKKLKKVFEKNEKYKIKIKQLSKCQDQLQTAKYAEMRENRKKNVHPIG
jgi:hypothetical protein